MPTYDFRCAHCDSVFEAFRSFTQGTDDVTCPADGTTAQRLFSPPMDLLVYGREPASWSAKKTPVPPGAISCHDHEPDGSHSHGGGHGRGGAHAHDPSDGHASPGGHGNTHGPGTTPHHH